MLSQRLPALNLSDESFAEQQTLLDSPAASSDFRRLATSSSNNVELLDSILLRSSFHKLEGPGAAKCEDAFTFKPAEVQKIEVRYKRPSHLISFDQTPTKVDSGVLEETASRNFYRF